MCTIVSENITMFDMRKYNHISKLIREQENKINDMTTSEPDLSNVTNNGMQQSFASNNYQNVYKQQLDQQRNVYAISGSISPVGITSSIAPYKPLDTQEINIKDVVDEFKSDQYQLMKEGLGEKCPPAGYKWVLNPSTMMHELRSTNKGNNHIAMTYNSITRKITQEKLDPTSDIAFNLWLNDNTNRSLDEFCNRDDVEVAPTFTFIEKCMLYTKMVFANRTVGVVSAIGLIVLSLILIF